MGHFIEIEIFLGNRKIVAKVCWEVGITERFKEFFAR